MKWIKPPCQSIGVCFKIRSQRRVRAANVRRRLGMRAHPQLCAIENENNSCVQLGLRIVGCTRSCTVTNARKKTNGDYKKTTHTHTHTESMLFLFDRIGYSQNRSCYGACSCFPSWSPRWQYNTHTHIHTHTHTHTHTYTPKHTHKKKTQPRHKACPP